jgi:hypothetical protein
MTKERKDKTSAQTQDPIEIIAEVNPSKSSGSDPSSKPRPRGSFDWFWELAH